MPDEAFRRLLGVFRRSPDRIANDVDDELRFHLEMRAAELQASGLTKADAKRAAIREFGDLEYTRRFCRDLDQEGERADRRREWFAELKQDLRITLRGLRRTPGFAFAALVTLALGIGANTAVYGVLSSVLLRPSPFPDPERLVAIYENNVLGGRPRSDISPADFLDWSASQRAFVGIAAHGYQSFTFTEGRFPEELRARRVSANMFDVLGARAVIGRTFLPGEDRGPHRLVVITYGLWQRLFGGDSSIVGRQITLSGAPFSVIGVLGPEFIFPGSETSLFVPIDFVASMADPNRARRFHNFYAFGRVREGTSIARARADLLSIAQRLEREHPDDNKGHLVSVLPLDDALVGGVRPVLGVLMGAAVFVFLIACANVANLALTRAMARRREFGIRVALGAGTGRLVRQTFTESVFISLLGGVAGFAVARWGTGALLALHPSALPPTYRVNIDLSVFGFATGAALIAGMLFGALPAFATARQDAHHALRDGSRAATRGGDRRLRFSLVALQLALSMILLVGAGLLLRTLTKLHAVDMGFDPDNVTITDIALSGPRYQRRLQIIELWDRLVDRLREDNKVVSVAVGSGAPMWGGSNAGLAIEGRPAPPGPLPQIGYFSVSDDYFRTLGVPLHNGRSFERTDQLGTPGVVVVNEAAARKFWPGASPIGAHVRLGPDPSQPWSEVVGVVGDVRQYGPENEPRPAAFLTQRQDAWTHMIVLVRSAAPPQLIDERVRGVLRELDPALALSNVHTLNEIIGMTLARQRFAMSLLTVFGTVALVLAIVGVYGVIGYDVAIRRREFGVRIALGALPGQVVRPVLRQTMAMAAVGLGFGLAGAITLTGFLRGLLYDIGPTDPRTLTVVLFALLAASLTASLLPARRATRANPVEVLRND